MRSFQKPAPTPLKPWSGGACPEHPESQIRPFYRGAQASMSRITCAPAGRLDWSHDGGPDDIVAYAVDFDASQPVGGAA